MRHDLPRNHRQARTSKQRARDVRSERPLRSSARGPYAMTSSNAARLPAAPPEHVPPARKSAKRKLLDRIAVEIAYVDRRLRPAAAAPERFERLAKRLISDLDRRGSDLELRDPMSWRQPLPAAAGAGSLAPSKTAWEHQFRADVDRITIMEREEEADHARRIEFARLRLAKARRDHGLPVETPDVAPPNSAPHGGAEEVAAGWSDEPETLARPIGVQRSPLPPEVARRAAELHALRTELVERNLYLVLINVERYVHHATSRADLIQEGCVSLFRAVDGFDWRRGLLFRTYAVHWLNQAFRNYLYNQTQTVRVPVYLQKAIKHVHEAQLALGDANASHAELAAAADVPEHIVGSALAAARTTYSMDGDLGGESDGGRLKDILVQGADEGPYSTRLEDITLGEGLAGAMARLSDRERTVIGMRFGVGAEREHTLSEVAHHLGVSVERVRQIQMRGLAKLNTPQLKRELEPWLN
jgi:RNA polymerase sigma factor (sigma-70 family)